MTITCKAPGCSAPGAVRTSGGDLCAKHRSRWYRHGRLDIAKPRTRRIVVSGQQFGSWTVVGVVDSRKGSGSTTPMALCACSCGTTKAVAIRRLYDGTSKSCGCKQYVRVNAIERFWRRVDKRGPTDCWQWKGGTGRNGYGRFRLGGKNDGQEGPHRFAYELKHGPIPDGLYACHICDNPSCVNPDHIYAGTPKSNIMDAINRNRAAGQFRNGPDQRRAHGEESHFAKITTVDVIAIRSDERPTKDIASDYGISVDGVRRIKRRQVWKHV